MKKLDLPPITANFIANFINAYLIEHYEKPTPLAVFHKDALELVCDPDEHVAMAAPRGHSKSTTVTFAYVLTNMLFRARNFAVIIANTHDDGVRFLATLRDALLYNEDIFREFGILPVSQWDTDSKDEIVVCFKDGHKFCIHATGIEQYSRGIKWIHQRPDLIVCDDVEDDEMVMSFERREKLKDKVLSTVLPSGAPGCLFRVVGTILHLDSWLQSLLDSPEWTSRVWEAHNDDFTEILWPARFDEDKLKEIRAKYAIAGKLEKYNMEYRNKPVDTSTGYFRKGDFLAMGENDWREIQNKKCRIIGSIDFAWTQKQRSDYTVFMIAAVNSFGEIMIIDVVRDRMDARQQEGNLFALEFTYNGFQGGLPVTWFPERGAISETLKLSIEKEQVARNCYLDLNSIDPASKDKKMRAIPFQARARSRKVKVNKDAEWWPAFELELMQFDRGLHDDQVDACALLGMGLATIGLPDGLDVAEEDDDFTPFKKRYVEFDDTRNPVTGY